MFEPLESRRLFTVTLVDGVLTVTGTEEADQLAVGRNQTQIVVNDNGTASMWNPAEVMSIAVNGLGGDDLIAIKRGVLKPILIDAGTGNDRVLGGTGREHILGGAGMDLLNGGGGGDLLEGGPDNDMIVGGAGEDRMLGNAGNDRFDAVDYSVDLLDGGDGDDFARVNRPDHTMNIEHIHIAPPPGGSNVIDTKPEESEIVSELLA